MNSNEEDRVALEKEIAYLERQCKELGIDVHALLRDVGMKPQLITQWKWRLKRGDVTNIRESTKKKLHEKLAELRKEKLGAKKIEVTNEMVRPSTPVITHPQAMQVICDDDLPVPKPQSQTPVRYTSGHEALLYIIKEKLAGYTLVQLALLLAYMENGKEQR